MGMDIEEWKKLMEEDIDEALNYPLFRSVEVDEQVERVENNEEGWVIWDGVYTAPITLSVQDVDRWRAQPPPSYKFEREKTYAEKMDERFSHWCFSEGCQEPLEYGHALTQYLKENNLDYQYFVVNRNTSLNYTHGLFMMAKHKRELIKQFKVWWRDDRFQFYCCVCFREVEF